MGVTSVLLLVTAAARAEPPESLAPGDPVAASPQVEGGPSEEAGPSEEGGLSEEVVVTANRTAQELKDVPANITVLDEVEIEATAGLTTDAVLHRVPGVTMLRQQSSLVSSPATQETNVRNLGSGSARTLVLLDGVPLNDSAGGQVYWSRVPPPSIDRVEVIRGAGSNVWGNRAMAGVISLFTKRPTERAVDVTALLGERNTSDLTLFGAQTFGSVALSIAADGFDSDGYQVFREDVRGAVDEASTKEYQSYTFKLEAPLSQRASAFLRATYFDEDQDLGTPIRQAMTEIQEVVAGADLVTQSLDEWAFRLFTTDTDASSRDALIARDRNSEVLNESLEQPSSSIGVNATWSRRAGERHRLMSGIDWLWIDTDFDQQTDLVGGEFTRERMIPGKQQLGGLFFQDLMELSPKWRLTAAGRMDYIRNYGGGSRLVTGGGVVDEVEYDSFSSETFNPTVGVVYHATPQASWRATAYRGFRAPTAAELYRESTARGGVVVAPNPDLDPEHLTGVETGLILSRQTWSGQVTLFRNEIRDRSTILDVQAQGPTGGIIEPCGFIQPNGICRVRANIGEATVNGAELDLDYRPLPPWSFSLSYLFEDAEFSEAPDNPELEGLVPRHVPEHSYTARMAYSNHRILSASVQGRYVGERFEDDANLLPIASLFAVDVTASKAVTERIAIFANVENVFDEPYEVRLTSTLVEIGSPRWVYGGVRLSF
jgi:outer membrane receptor protein involved in Fe transport